MSNRDIGPFLSNEISKHLEFYDVPMAVMMDVMSGEEREALENYVLPPSIEPYLVDSYDVTDIFSYKNTDSDPIE